jgi:MFS family permease
VTAPRLRYLIVFMAAVAAFWMYIDRTCFSTLSPTVRDDLGIRPGDMPAIEGAFFLTYALLQIPVGMLADRFGPRAVLTGCVAGWSATVLGMAFAADAAQLLALRYLLGATEAGAYPTAAALIRRWALPDERGLFSSLVALGGRLGGVAAPFLSARLATLTLGWSAFGPAAEGGNWRAVFALFGVAGLVVAVAFWLVVRDRPPHSAAATEPADRLPPWQVQFRLIASSRNMWLSGAMQFGINLGWAFVLTRLPTYLRDVHHRGLNEIGNMQTVTLLVGSCGMLCGGWLTDGLRRRVGVRWARSGPLAVSLAGCAVAYLACAAATDPWVVVALVAAMAFLVDLSNPSVWAFAQDVGGRYAGAALGWGNMIGNLGAFASPRAFDWVATQYGWDTVFVGAAVSFALAAAFALRLDAATPLTAAEGGRPDRRQ